MKGKKELLARALHEGGILSRMTHFPSWRGPDVRILAYHRILDIVDEAQFPFDPELISASTADFREQIEHVATHFAPVPLVNLLSALDGGPPLPRRAVVITFDDGHLDNYFNAFPVLQSLGVPATFFLSTGYIGSTDNFWFDQVSYTLFHALGGTLAFPGMETPLRLSDVASRRQAADVVRAHLKSLPDRQRREQVEWLVDSCQPNSRVSNVGLSGAMTWEQVLEMSRAGMEFGSHAVTHPILTQLDDAALERELVDSRTAIANTVGKPVNVIAYPDGGTNAFDARVIGAVQNAGYQLGMSYIPGTNYLDHLDRFAVQRLHVERYTSRSMFRAMLELPGIFSR